MGNENADPDTRGEKEEAIRLNNLATISVDIDNFTYGSSGTPTLGKIELSVKPGEILAIVGRSGCGKSTLLNLLAGLVTLKPEFGEISIDGVDRRGSVGYMLARDALVPWRRALGNVELSMEVAGDIDRAERRQRAERLLHEVGLGNVAGKWPNQLSQGMRQRVALARTYAIQPSLILMDEPFAALDAYTKLNMQDLFLQTHLENPSTVVWVTHDLSEAVLVADRVCVMVSGPGRVVEICQVPLPRPRNASDFVLSEKKQEIERRLWELVGTTNESPISAEVSDGPSNDKESK